MALSPMLRRGLSRAAHRLGLRPVLDQSTRTALAEFDEMLLLLLRQAGLPADAARAQLKQDIAALLCNGFRRGGFFVDVGAADGTHSSNTAMLETEFGWTGICAEPNPVFHEDLRATRRCAIDTRCVWRATGDTLSFHFAQDRTLSTLSEFVDCDHHGPARAAARIGTVETVSLNDLLKAHGAPAEVDFLSIDTEGSELAILEAFDFSTTRFGFIAVEHNYAPNRAPLHALLTGKGYRRIWTRLSEWDDWYVPDPPRAPSCI